MANCCKDFMLPLFPALTSIGTIVLSADVTKSTSALPDLLSQPIEEVGRFQAVESIGQMLRNKLFVNVQGV